ncbi:hypothetical protein SAMN04490244_11525 [Tranquillimonas rosea]|uniref:Sulfotransferase family protein n=1 Tax=Tranquillimonas rosea TaxID=641238 RepID=A0A1H9WYZ9_9RHOB|nr:sulfotransferase family 2 domain-containing protein [Tranquillimonas rosea]SES39188.1 hypothetical protein SAMN04490244_11525 [Tranquillimonas rosea]
MLIGVKKRFVFVANTKAASTSIEAALIDQAEIHRGGSPARKHISLREALREYRFLFGQEEHRPRHFLKFGVMRDPIDWIGSWFRYRKGNKVDQPLPAGMTFAEFWQRADWNIRRPDGSKHLQGERFLGPKGGVMADVILPYHDLETGFARLCEGLGLPCRLPRRNVSRLDEIGEEIDPDLRAEMRAFYADDYALFDRIDEINAKGFARLESRRQESGS